MVTSACQCPWGPVGPMVNFPFLHGLLVLAGVVFSIVMLIDCLRRKPTDFANPLTKNAEYDKLIWAGAIFLSLWFFYVGAIVYLFVVKVAKAEKKAEEKQE